MIAERFSAKARFLSQIMAERGITLTYADCDMILVEVNRRFADFVGRRPLSEKELDELTRRST